MAKYTQCARLPFYSNGRAKAVLEALFDDVLAKWKAGILPVMTRIQQAHVCLKLDADTDGTAVLMEYSAISYMQNRIKQRGLGDIAATVKKLVLDVYQLKEAKLFTHTNMTVLIPCNGLNVTVKDLRYLYELFHDQPTRMSHYTTAEIDAYTGHNSNPFVLSMIEAMRNENAKFEEGITAKIVELRRELTFKIECLEKSRKAAKQILAAKINYMLVHGKPMPAEEVEKIEV